MRPSPRRTAVLALALVACTKADKESPPIKRAEPTLSARPAAVAPPAPASTPPAPPSFVAWTEPGGVESLVRGVPMSSDDKDPRSCRFDMPQQSCIPGSDAVLFSCRSECASTCESCDQTCRATLTNCRKACAPGDAPCATACATKTGACVQGCLKARDGCATGTCVQVMAAYTAEVMDNFGCKNKKRRPFELCEAASACIRKCQDQTKLTDAQQTACNVSCKKTHLAGCKDSIASTAESHACVALDDSP